VSSDDRTTRLPQWRPGQPEPSAPYTLADEDRRAWDEEFIPEVPLEFQRPLIPVYELNEMISYIIDGLRFENSPFANRPAYYKEAWDRTKGDAENIWAREHEVVPINDPG
jgi:hypothetical protein